MTGLARPTRPITSGTTAVSKIQAARIAQERQACRRYHRLARTMTPATHHDAGVSQRTSSAKAYGPLGYQCQGPPSADGTKLTRTSVDTNVSTLENCPGLPGV